MEPNSKLAVGSAMLQMANARLVANMILSGVCERFPRLKFVSLVESGIGWLPFMLEACLDYHADENAASGLSLLPSEYFQRQIYACFWFENGPSEA